MIDDFKKVIRKLDASKSCGLDKIPANILKDCNEIIPPYLTYIYNCSISTAIFPDDWKMARVPPIFRAGNKEDCDNYRPISILSTVAKIFEKLICGQLNKYLVKFNSNPFPWQRNACTLLGSLLWDIKCLFHCQRKYSL